MTPSERLDSALSTRDPFASALKLAATLKSEGLTQNQLHRVFNQARDVCHDTEGPKYDAILDVLDYITGWCSPETRLFPKSDPTDD